MWIFYLLFQIAMIFPSIPGPGEVLPVTLKPNVSMKSRARDEHEYFPEYLHPFFFFVCVCVCFRREKVHVCGISARHSRASLASLIALLLPP
jgi:hypothetical protein